LGTPENVLKRIEFELGFESQRLSKALQLACSASPWHRNSHNYAFPTEFSYSHPFPPDPVTKICWLRGPPVPREDPFQRAPKEPPRQMALRQEQSADMLYQRLSVFTSRCCKLISDQLPILSGNTRHRQRLPGL
jgi:hypothetical protein